jgi:DNA polymerase I-like protein with 3'-5' exonuclease and polymerase domains
MAYTDEMVLDVETFGTDPKNGKLLGIALATMEIEPQPVYVALQWYDYKTSTWIVNPDYPAIVEYLAHKLPQLQLIGHNYAYDKSWIDHILSINSQWKACTRLMWHMSSAPAGPRGYGLKDAQVEVLGWASKGSDDLEAQVKARGGSLKEGGHYLADLSVLGHYACLDAASTALLYKELSPFFDQHDYWDFLAKMVEYSWLLQENTQYGIRVDRNHLEATLVQLTDTMKASESAFMEAMKVPIARMERHWKEHRATQYTITSAKERFLSNWDLQKKFKLSSNKHKQELFYTELQLPVMQDTEKGQPATGVDAIKAALQAANKPELAGIGELYESYESCETLINSFVKPWLANSGNGRLHPRFNPCGTVSYRLSGFKPYLLNAPFDEHQVMSSLTCDEGWEGVHADFASIEPCVTAHYSQDPTLLKIFREGKGDVYLDLARTLFPGDTALSTGYDPNAPCCSEIKERYKQQRKIAKIIQLAVQYTGTKFTVSKNLTFNGFPTTLAEADLLVKAYWKHFHKVAVMNEVLFRKFERDGLLRNVVGRIIRVPTTIAIKKKDGTIWNKPIRYKDLPNRFIQSSAHDLLTMWVLKINEKVKRQGLKAKPVIVDCHDSTSWQAPKEEVVQLEQIFITALAELNDEVRMTVPVRMEMKRFQTLAGLKGDEK